MGPNDCKSCLWIGIVFLSSTAITFSFGQALPVAPARAPLECGAAPVHTGKAMFYTFADGTGSCGFPATPNDLMIGAMNSADFDGSYVCGTCVEVTGPNSTAIIRIVDLCPGCKPGDIDLSKTAFSKIAPIRLGTVPITWRLAACQVEGPILYHFKSGSSKWWTAVQIRNHRYPILRLEYKNQDGEFEETERTGYNYFVKAKGMGPGPYTFRVTDLFGHTLVDTGIVHMPNREVAGAAQFPLCD